MLDASADHVTLVATCAPEPRMDFSPVAPPPHASTPPADVLNAAAPLETRYFPWIAVRLHSQGKIWRNALLLWIAVLLIVLVWLCSPLGPHVLVACSEASLVVGGQSKLLFIVFRLFRYCLGCWFVLRLFLHAGVAVPNTMSQVLIIGSAMPIGFACDYVSIYWFVDNRLYLQCALTVSLVIACSHPLCAIYLCNTRFLNAHLPNEDAEASASLRARQEWPVRARYWLVCALLAVIFLLLLVCEIFTNVNSLFAESDAIRLTLSILFTAAMWPCQKLCQNLALKIDACSGASDDTVARNAWDEVRFAGIESPAHLLNQHVTPHAVMSALARAATAVVGTSDEHVAGGDGVVTEVGTAVATVGCAVAHGWLVECVPVPPNSPAVRSLPDSPSPLVNEEHFLDELRDELGDADQSRVRSMTALQRIVAVEEAEQATTPSWYAAFLAPHPNACGRRAVAPVWPSICWLVALYQLVFSRQLFITFQNTLNLVLIQLLVFVIELWVYAAAMAECVRERQVAGQAAGCPPFLLGTNPARVSLLDQRSSLSERYFWQCMAQRVSLSGFLAFSIFLQYYYGENDVAAVFNLGGAASSSFGGATGLMRFSAVCLAIEWLGSTIVTLVILAVFDINLVKVGGLVLVKRHIFWLCTLSGVIAFADLFLNLNTLRFSC